MPKCRFCNADIPDRDAVVVLIPSPYPTFQLLWTLYCSESCLEDWETVDKRLTIARDPHRERPPKHR